MILPGLTEANEAARAAALVNNIHRVVANLTPGDIAEFGVGLGTSLRTIAETVHACDPLTARTFDAPRDIYAFDTFTGLPPATAKPDTDSPLVKSGMWGAGACGQMPKEEALKLLPPNFRGHLYVAPGLFADSLSRIPPKTKFALVHLDCDLYASTLEVLDYLFAHDHLSDGCTLMFDDFLENRASPRFGQRKAWDVARDNVPGNPMFTDLGFYARAGWHCCLHFD